ncbi:MAG TPA: hypothetical protein ENK82_01570 [Campylobacterales bacterium]|nr:hypothetical protein [Campylobacterales bacterium]
MIRFVYWFLVIVEVLLLLGALLLFIVTDSRTVKYIVDTTAETSHLSYGNIEGNIFGGLYVTQLRYKQKPLFASATIHWNPFTLLYNKITITEIDAQGLEVENILFMFKEIGTQESTSESGLGLSLTINTSHFDINPYVYEGVKFSSFVLESGKIEVDEDLTVNTGPLYLKFDSDIVNLELNAKIDEGVMLVDTLKLNSISSKDITKLSRRVRQKYRDHNETKSTGEVGSKEFLNPIREIRVAHVMGTLKPVAYGSVKVNNVHLDIYNLSVDPNNDFLYQAEQLAFKGSTNFGDLSYKGEIKDSNIYAKGRVDIDRELFSHYKIPLKANAFKNLRSKLRLNHDAFWIDIDHKVTSLLEIKSDFDIALRDAKHTLHYDYASDVFDINSALNGSMNYADELQIKNRVIVDDEVSFEGDVTVSKFKGLPDVASEYLLEGLKGSYEGSDVAFKMELESKLLEGQFTMKNYKRGFLKLQSKSKNILLSKFVENLPEALKKHQVTLESQADLDMDDIEKSKIKVKAISEMFKLNANMTLKEPYHVKFSNQLKDTILLERTFSKVDFSNLSSIEGEVIITDKKYDIALKNKHLLLKFNYDTTLQTILNGNMALGRASVDFNRLQNGEIMVQSNTKNLQSYFDELKQYYKFEFPNLQGEAKVEIKKDKNDIYEISLKSKHLKYLFEDGVKLSIQNFYDIALNFKVKNLSEIVLENYQFRIDENGYFSHFFSNKRSFLALNGTKLIVKKFWLNNEIAIHGEYDIEEERGSLKMNSNHYNFSNKDFNLDANLDLVLKIKGKKIDVNGEILLLGKHISYEMAADGIVEDSDIVILDEMLEKEESAFKNLKLYLKIKTKKPLVYKSEVLKADLTGDVSILKNYNQEMMITGHSGIEKGLYTFEDKDFRIDKSHLYFTGNYKKPLLDIKASYTKEEYNIHIFISGTTDAPIINFNAEPYLTQQEIMSLILFDGTGSSKGTGAEAYTILGGTFAKGLIKSLGIDIDHLLLGQNENQELSLEIGKKITDDVSVLYLRKDGLDGVKVEVEHTDNFETDIIIQPPNSSSIEFLYKQDR